MNLDRLDLDPAVRRLRVACVAPLPPTDANRSFGFETLSVCLASGYRTCPGVRLLFTSGIAVQVLPSGVRRIVRLSAVAIASSVSTFRSMLMMRFTSWQLPRRFYQCVGSRSKVWWPPAR